MALAVIVLVGVGAGALLLRPSGGVLSQGRGPLGNGGLTVGIAALWCVAALLVNARYRERFGRYDDRRTAGDQRLADVVRYVLLLAPVAVPVLLLGLHRFGHDRERPYRRTAPPPPTRGSAPVRPLRPHKPASDQQSLHLPAWLLHLEFGLAIAVAVAALAYAAWYLLRLLKRPEPDAPQGTFTVVDDEEEILAQAVDSGRRALRDIDDARAAVIACYAAMESSLAASGVARRVSDSPQDLLERAATGGLLTGPAAGDLTELFREARYSTHPMDDSHRRRASDALAEIAARLEQRAAQAAAASATAEATP